MPNYNLAEMAALEMGMEPELKVTEVTDTEPNVTYKERYQRVNDLRIAMNQAFLEREQLITVMFTSLVAKDNIAIVGLPGTAKSMGIRAIAANVYNSEMFEFICDKFTKPSDLLGSVSIPDMKNGIDKIRINGKLGTCHFGFLDEGFKLNGATLNGLLGVLNDKRVWNGTSYTPSPLISCIVASNEYPTSKELGALWDRFPLRFHVDPITSDDNFRRLIFDSQEVNSPIELEDIYAMQAEVDNCSFCDAAFEVLLELRSQVKAQRIYVSDRRWKKAVKILKAYSVLESKDSVDRESFNILKHMLWDKESQRSTIADIIDALPAIKNAEQIQEETWRNAFDAEYEAVVCSWEDNDWMTSKELKLIDMNEHFINKWKDHELLKRQPKLAKNFDYLRSRPPVSLGNHLTLQLQNLTTDIANAKSDGRTTDFLQLATSALKACIEIQQKAIPMLEGLGATEHTVNSVKEQIETIQGMMA